MKLKKLILHLWPLALPESEIKNGLSEFYRSIYIEWVAG